MLKPTKMPTPPNHAPELELSVVLPCLNEARTVGACVQEALAAMAAAGIVGEVIVADNGSTDGSQALATGKGARVVSVSEKGYGHALRRGFAAARGRFIVMGDADQSYDFSHVPRFVEKLRAGYDLAAKASPAVHGIIPVGEAWIRAFDAGIADRNPYDGIEAGKLIIEQVASFSSSLISKS